MWWSVLCELTAAFVKGAVTFFKAWREKPDPRDVWSADHYE